AFSYCSRLTSLEIPNGVTDLTISNGAFQSSSLASLTIPNSVTDLIIGDSVFYNCQSLTSLEIPNSVTNTINSSSAFRSSSLKLVTIPDTANKTIKVLFYNEGIDIINSILEAAPPISDDDNYTFDLSEVDSGINLNDLTTPSSDTRWIIKFSNEVVYKWDGEDWMATLPSPPR
ncbi:MAG: leucine-rich repeat domain-containing protein, partial [Holosporales bacterium]|nr:leucine-rich repeat domain-containing protein [Holosporales bacterium]